MPMINSLQNLESAVLTGNLEDVDWITRTSNMSAASYFILKEAISSGQIEAAKLLIKRGCPLSENLYSQENELLHIAVTAGDLELVQLMIERNVSIKTLDKDGIPPLFKLVHISSGCVNYPEFLYCLLVKDKNNAINMKHQDRLFNILHYAAEMGNAKIIPCLVKYSCQINARSYDGSTPLHIAVKNSHPHVVQSLLKEGIKDSIVDNENLTPLYFAVKNGDFKTFQILLSHTLRSVVSKNRCFQSKENRPLIYLATSARNSELVESLVEHGAALDFHLPETNRSALHLAVMNEDIQIVDLLKHKISIAEPDISGFTPFHLACIKGNLPIIFSLLETNQYNVNAKSKSGYTPLHLASINGKSEVVSLLLERGADCKAIDEFKNTPLSYALQNINGDVESLKLLLKHLRRIENIESNYSLLLPEDHLLVQYHTEAKYDKNGNSALHLAVERENQEVVRLLLEHKACTDARNKNNLRPLDLATINGSFSIVNLFLQNRINPETLFLGRCIDGFTPMHFAVEEGNIDMLEVFFKAGISADLPYKTGFSVNASKQTGLTPLHVAVRKNDKNLILLLLKNGAKVDVPGRTDFETPLFVAAEIGNTEILEILTEASTTRSSEWSEGYLPMYIAAYRGHEKFVKMLLDKGVNPNANVEKYLPPLHAAAQQGHENIVRLLLERGAMVNPRRKYYLEQFSSTPLLAACYAKHYGIVRLLLENSADFNAELKVIHTRAVSMFRAGAGHSKQLNTQTFESIEEISKMLEQGSYVDSEVGENGSLLGYRTLHFAVEAGEVAVIKLLLKSGASLNFETRTGLTGIGLSIEREDESVLKLLLSAGASVLSEHKKKSIFDIEVLKTNVKIAEIVVKYVACSQSHSNEINVTPLGMAVENQLEACVEKLLQCGTNVHIKHKQEPLLHIAVKKKNYNIAKMLLNHGVNVNRCAKNGSSALLVAVENNQLQFVELLLDAGADDKMSDLRYYSCYAIYEPLKVAIINKNAEIVEMFLKRGLTDSDSTHNSLFQLALKKSSPQVVHKFIYYKIPMNLKEESPIFYAIEGNNLEVVRFLLKTNAFMNDRTKKGETILQFAMNTYSISLDLFQALIDHGVDVNAQNKENLSPLNLILNKKYKHLISISQDKKESLLNILLANGANPNQLDTAEEKRILELVIENENIKYVKLLLLYGVDINFLNKKNERSPFETAITKALLLELKYEITYVGRLGNQISRDLDNLTYDQLVINSNDELKNFRILPSREILRVFMQEIIRRQAAKEKVHALTAHIIISKHFLKSYHDRCWKEIELMKITEICKKVSYFHILVAETNGLATYARNVHVKRVLLAEDLVTNLFPEYGKILIDRIVIGRDRRHLLDCSYHLLTKMISFNFPLLVVEHIFSFLTNKDLRSLQIANEMCSN